MPFDWQQLIEVARQLGQQADGDATRAEAYRRSAIGRAYYGAFCCVRKYAAENLSYAIKGSADDHGALRHHLKGKWKGVSDRLDRRRRLRNEADYLDELQWDDAALTVAEAIETAEKVLASVPESAT